MGDTIMTTFHPSSTRMHRSRGVSLIIVLIMMIIIGITAATAMRSATSEQRATNNMRVEASALQYAEAALRYCENEMKKSPASRPSTLQTANIYSSTGPGPTVSGWGDPATWTGSGGRASASRTEVPDSVIQDTTDTVLPNKNPECVVENMAGYGMVITARGYSPDYVADGSTGYTTSGAVVWLQSITN